MYVSGIPYIQVSTFLTHLAIFACNDSLACGSLIRDQRLVAVGSSVEGLRQSEGYAGG